MAATRTKILIVDDEADICAVVERRLALQGYDVICANTGYDGLNKARSERPDLILLDLLLPGIDGNQICAMLKRDLRYRDIPVIILSARSQLKDIEVSMKCGADAYVTKPYDHQILLAQIQYLLAARKSVEKPAAPTTAAADGRAVRAAAGSRTPAAEKATNESRR
jgi:DNA-binding response OmpR family regulator